MGTVVEAWLAEGLAKGIEEGIEQGIQQGVQQGRKEALRIQRRTLLRILRRRFELSEDDIINIVECLAEVTDLERLIQFVDYTLDATSVTDFINTVETSRY